jgi:hypothetical protein
MGYLLNSSVLMPTQKVTNNTYGKGNEKRAFSIRPLPPNDKHGTSRASLPHPYVYARVDP